ncbi:endoplasmic reticulum lectin 1 isoform X1 [Sarcophilus harrisii]|uniref:Endoplasmic reticulum lectin n=1 Tax=Sarcophilus harrisii TaxID=9305 RepID=G3WPI5_SARHA|nr:endoplasmic reticulum lectin 1 isoform X1 [Sarcophilus harrisii]
MGQGGSDGGGGGGGGWRRRRRRMEEGGGGGRRLVPGAPVLLVLCGLLEASGGGRVLPPLSDDIPFRVNWPGTEFTLVEISGIFCFFCLVVINMQTSVWMVNFLRSTCKFISLPSAGVFYKEDNYVIMTTADKEKYKCILPLVASGDEEEEKDYKGPSPGELLEPLFKQSSCSYRIESYWTYEVCHGKHIRQYHEEKETGQKINIQEYFLGNRMKKSILTEAEKEEKENENSKENSKEIPTKNIEGQMTPYYPVGMGNGTPCSLRQNLPRSSTVMYICHPEAKHEILSVAEVTTCEYEVVILTPLLCSHPKYRFRSSPVNDIFCQSLPGSPLKPHNLVKLEQQQEVMKIPFRKTKEEEVHSTKEDKLTPVPKPVALGTHQLLTVGTTHISKLTDDQLIKEFLRGSYCFHGGVGWWKYEFCYGKHVHQYHEDKESGKTSVIVGTWNKEEHIEWAKKNTARAFLLRDDGTQIVRMVSHFYGNGDICDLTDKPRHVTVKLKCKESESPHAVTVYMLEPHSCQYILGVESPVICKILDTADENGLLSIPS